MAVGRRRCPHATHLLLTLISSSDVSGWSVNRAASRSGASPRSYCEGIYGGAGAMPVWPPLSQIKPFRQDGTAYWSRKTGARLIDLPSYLLPSGNGCPQHGRRCLRRSGWVISYCRKYHFVWRNPQFETAGSLQKAFGVRLHRQRPLRWSSLPCGINNADSLQRYLVPYFHFGSWEPSPVIKSGELHLSSPGCVERPQSPGEVFGNPG